MSITPECLYRFAQVCGDSADEVAIRSAISRGYYSVLHAAQALLPEQCEQERLAKSVNGTHNAVIFAYQKFGNQEVAGRTEARELARIIRRIKDRRVVADYELSTDVARREWEVVRRDIDIALEKMAILFEKIQRSPGK